MGPHILELFENNLIVVQNLAGRGRCIPQDPGQDPQPPVQDSELHHLPQDQAHLGQNCE